VDAGLGLENAPNKEVEPPLRFNRNGKGSRGPARRFCISAERSASGQRAAATDNGVSWNGETLFERMNDPTCDYALHATDDLLLISSSRETRGIKYALLCGFFVRSQIKATPSAVRELIRAACRFWKHLFFVYAGINTSLSRLPGVALPARLRKPVLVQLRDFTTDEPTVRFDRFQLIDSDFV
jgi:hypothetical protein